MTSGRAEPEPILPQVSPTPWSDQAAVAYEVAIEGLSQAIGIYSTRIWEEQHRPAPDQNAIGGWSAARQRLVSQRETLRPDDRGAVERVQQECADLIRNFQSGS